MSIALCQLDSVDERLHDLAVTCHGEDQGDVHANSSTEHIGDGWKAFFRGGNLHHEVVAFHRTGKVLGLGNRSLAVTC